MADLGTMSLMLALALAAYAMIGSIRRSEIDQVTIVTDHARRAGLFMPLQCFEFGKPIVARFVSERRDSPLPLVLGEDLHTVHLQALSFIESIDQPACDGKVRSEHKRTRSYRHHGGSRTIHRRV